VSYLFDAVDDRIQFTNPPANWPTQVTIVAWIEPNAAFSSRAAVLLGYTNTASEAHGLAGFTGGQLRYEAAWTGGRARWVSAGGVLALDAWQGVAASYDASSTANDALLYYKPEGGSISALPVTEEAAPSGTLEAPLHSLWSGGVFTTYLFPGRIAYVRMFGSILSQAEIDAEMDSLAAIAAAMGDWPFVADADDDSGNARHGTLLGGPTLDADNPTLAGGGGGGSVPFLLISDEPMDEIRQKGATNQTVEVFFRDATTGLGKLGLVFNSAGLGILYYRPGAATATAITLADLAGLNAAHADGGFLEIGGGWYRLDLPDAVVATGVDRVRLQGSATGAVMTPFSIVLTDYDPIAVGASPADIVDAIDADSTQLAKLGTPAGASLAADIAAVASDVDAVGVLSATIDGKADTLLAADASYKKNVAVANFGLYMELVGGSPGTGLAVTGQVSKDGAAFTNLAGAVTEIGSGFYRVNLSQSEMNADEILLKFTAAGAKQRNMKLRTQS